MLNGKAARTPSILIPLGQTPLPSKSHLWPIAGRIHGRPPPVAEPCHGDREHPTADTRPEGRRPKSGSVGQQGPEGSDGTAGEKAGVALGGLQRIVFHTQGLHGGCHVGFWCPSRHILELS